MEYTLCILFPCRLGCFGGRDRPKPISARILCIIVFQNILPKHNSLNQLVFCEYHGIFVSNRTFCWTQLFCRIHNYSAEYSVMREYLRRPTSNFVHKIPVDLSSRLSFAFEGPGEELFNAVSCVLCEIQLCFPSCSIASVAEYVLSRTFCINIIFFNKQNILYWTEYHVFCRIFSFGRILSFGKIFLILKVQNIRLRQITKIWVSVGL